jgi:hypothetical protein
VGVVVVGVEVQKLKVGSFDLALTTTWNIHLYLILTPMMPKYNENEKSGDMEEYEKMKKELKELINKKRTMDKNLNTLEDQIYKFEGAYLEDTSNGNIIRGYDNYIKTNQTKRRASLNETDRLFSLSSAVFLKVKMKEDEGN